MADGVSQPGGAGTKICIHNDSYAFIDNPGTIARTVGPYTMAQISQAFPAVIVDNGTNRKTYRCIQDIQIGDLTADAATTTLADTNVGIFFDSGITLRCRSTESTSWYLRLGTKIGTGNQSSGKDGCEMVFGLAPGWPTQSFVYGSTIRQTAGAFLMSGGANQLSESVNNIFQSKSTGTTPFSIGVSGAEYVNIYNVDFSHVTTAQVMANFGALSAERITIGCAAPSTFLQTGGASVAIKDLALFGSPTVSDLRWTSVAAIDWKLVRPLWTGNAAKFTIVGAASLPVGDAAVEYWLFDVKCVDGAGTAISGLPVKLTDTIGNVQVDTTTNSAGEITFGSGILTKAVAVMDHYTVTGVYTQRHRGPFLVEVNMPTQTGYNSAYRSHYVKFKWGGHETITTTAGSFEDMNDVFQMEPIPGNPVTWQECSL